MNIMKIVFIPFTLMTTICSLTACEVNENEPHIQDGNYSEDDVINSTVVPNDRAIPYPIVGTGQTTSYDTTKEITIPLKGDTFYGQNSNFPGNTPSYTDNGDGTITDNVTGLLWTKKYKVMSYKEAIEDVKKWAVKGWRIPSIKEAYSLIIFTGKDASNNNIDNNPEPPAGSRPFIDDRFFEFEYGSNGSRCIDVQILSTTKYVGKTMDGNNNGGDETIFGVNVADGRIKGYPITKGQEAKLFTVFYVKGNVYGENNFIDNNDNTISDVNTGLMWNKNDSGEGLDWANAFAYAQQLNNENYAGYNDWRLPNAKELHSILDYSRSLQTTNSAAINKMFNSSSFTDERNCTNYGYYWTSTTHENAKKGPNAAVYFCFGEALGYMNNMVQDVHGAGSQRADSKAGEKPDYTLGNSPQGDIRRIYNYVRVVRDILQ